MFETDDNAISDISRVARSGGVLTLLFGCFVVVLVFARSLLRSIASLGLWGVIGLCSFSVLSSSFNERSGL